VIRPIQYLRAFAAFSVVWLHALNFPGVANQLGSSRFGGSGVDLFFVISGFIMVVTTAGKTVSAGEFFTLRIVRVVPLYWTVTLLVAAGAASGLLFKNVHFTSVELVKSLLFIPYHTDPVVVPGWTLNFEMFFYACFALSLLTPRRVQLRALLVTFGILVALGYWFAPSQPIPHTYTSPLILEFLAGSVIAYLWTREKLSLGLSLSVASMATGFFVLFQWNQPPLFGYTQMIGAVLVICGCLHPVICRFKSTLLLALGNASYSIYLTHLFILAALRVIWIKLVPDVSFASALSIMVIAIVTSAVSGWLCYRLIEKPLTSRLHGFVKLRDAARREPSVA
jgi:exopolysaccharide production protein ExoZ